MRKALVIGSEGQDGRLLCEYLLEQEYSVVGIGRANKSISPIKYISLDLSSFDLLEFEAILAEDYNEIYYLAAYHHSSGQDLGDEANNFVQTSIAVNINAFVKVLETVRRYKLKSKIFYASSSLIFSKSKRILQNEKSIPYPSCIYSISKNTASLIAEYYKNEYQVFVSVGILFNHESRLRDEKFISQKIITTARQIYEGKKDKLIVGDLSAKSDWGFAPDYVRAMYLVLQQKEPDNFIISSGELHSVFDWVENAFKIYGLNWKEYVQEDKSLIKRKKRALIGDNSKLRKITGWQPNVSFEEMVAIMAK